MDWYENWNSQQNLPVHNPVHQKTISNCHYHSMTNSIAAVKTEAEILKPNHRNCRRCRSTRRYRCFVVSAITYMTFLLYLLTLIMILNQENRWFHRSIVWKSVLRLFFRKIFFQKSSGNLKTKTSLQLSSLLLNQMISLFCCVGNYLQSWKKI